MLELIVFGRLSNLRDNTATVVVKATDGTNTATLQSTTLGATNGWDNFKISAMLSNFTKTSFVYNGEYKSAIAGNPIYNASPTLDSTKEITVSVEVIVNGVAADSNMNTFRILPRVIY